MGTVEGSCGYRTLGVSIRGKFDLSRNMGYKTRGGCHVTKNSSDPRQAYPEVKLQGRDLVRVVGIVAPFAPMGAGTRENSFYRTTGGGVWAQETCAGCL